MEAKEAIEADAEVDRLRRRLQDTEDALMRSNRRLIKPVKCQCPKCNESFSVEREAVQVQPGA